MKERFTFRSPAGEVNGLTHEQAHLRLTKYAADHGLMIHMHTGGWAGSSTACSTAYTACADMFLDAKAAVVIDAKDRDHREARQRRGDRATTTTERKRFKSYASQFKLWGEELREGVDANMTAQELLDNLEDIGAAVAHLVTTAIKKELETHRKIDPHCTCPDCIAHLEQMTREAEREDADSLKRGQ